MCLIKSFLRAILVPDSLTYTSKLSKSSNELTESKFFK